MSTCMWFPLSFYPSPSVMFFMRVSVPTPDKIQHAFLTSLFALLLTTVISFDVLYCFVSRSCCSGRERSHNYTFFSSFFFVFLHCFVFSLVVFPGRGTAESNHRLYINHLHLFFFFCTRHDRDESVFLLLLRTYMQPLWCFETTPVHTYIHTKITSNMGGDSRIEKPLNSLLVMIHVSSLFFFSFFTHTYQMNDRRRSTCVA